MQIIWSYKMQIIWSYKMHLTKHRVAKTGIKKLEFVAKTQFVLEPLEFRLSVAVLWIYNKYCKSKGATKHENHLWLGFPIGIPLRGIVLEFRGIVRNYAELQGSELPARKSTCVKNLIYDKHNMCHNSHVSISI